MPAHHRVLALVLITLPTLLASPLGAQQVDFDEHFEDRTMRLDYFHTGSADDEVVSLDRVVSDGPWAGSRSQLIDPTDMGKYRYEVRDAGSGEMLYSRGFASIYGEWETTGEAAEVHRTFHESVRFPWPRQPVRVSLLKRDGPASFAPLWRTAIDPASRFVSPADRAPGGPVHTIFESGPPVEKVDLVLVGEGYTEAQTEKFLADARRLTEAL